MVCAQVSRVVPCYPNLPHFFTNSILDIAATTTYHDTNSQGPKGSRKLISDHCYPLCHWNSAAELLVLLRFDDPEGTRQATCGGSNCPSAMPNPFGDAGR